MNVLINNKKREALKVHENPVALLYWAELLCPNDDYRICDTFPESYEVYSDFELRWLYYNASGETFPPLKDGTFDRKALIEAVEDEIDGFKPDVTTVEQLRKKLGRTLDTESSVSF